MKDQLVLMYIKDGIGYPVALNKEQLETFQFLINLIPQPINYIKDYPCGKATNLCKGIDIGKTTEEFLNEFMEAGE